MAEKQERNQKSDELATASQVQAKKNLSENVVGSVLDGSDQDTGQAPQGPFGWADEPSGVDPQPDSSQSTPPPTSAEENGPESSRDSAE